MQLAPGESRRIGLDSPRPNSAKKLTFQERSKDIGAGSYNSSIKLDDLALDLCATLKSFSSFRRARCYVNLLHDVHKRDEEQHLDMIFLLSRTLLGRRERLRLDSR